MKERPILFSGQMVRAILDRRKTQTRRVVKERHLIRHLGGSDQVDDPATWGWPFDGPDFHGYMVLGRGLNENHNNGRISIPCPYGEAGDRLWVRETWRPTFNPARGENDDSWTWTVKYAAGGDDLTTDDVPFEWDCPKQAKLGNVPGIHMPRWASRITLEVVSVRVERVQAITDADALAEGIPDYNDDSQIPSGFSRAAMNWRPVHEFQDLWQSINGKRPGCSWGDNPWVWAIEFRVVTP